MEPNKRRYLKPEHEEAFWKGQLVTKDSSGLSAPPLPEVSVTAPRLDSKPKVHEKPQPSGKPRERNAWYKFFDKHPYLALGYDALNTGLYFVPGGQPIAMAMSAAQGIAGAHDAYTNGTNLENGLDVASAIPGLGLSGKLAKFKGMKNFKNIPGIKILKPSTVPNTYKGLGKWATGSTTQRAIAGPILIEKSVNDALNIGQVGKDIYDLNQE